MQVTCLSVHITDGIAVEIQLVKALLVFKAEWGNQLNCIWAEIQNLQT